jgi:DUF1680 family protein
LAVPSEPRLYAASAPGVAGAAELVAVPYCAWDNRQAGPMRVWLATV